MYHGSMLVFQSAMRSVQYQLAGVLLVLQYVVVIRERERPLTFYVPWYLVPLPGTCYQVTVLEWP